MLEDEEGKNPNLISSIRLFFILLFMEDVGFLFCVSVFSSIQALPNLMACVLLSNLGESITKVAQDALVAEYGQEKNMTGF
ncbi:hypothetical protein PS1_040288 [Malus domestica]